MLGWIAVGAIAAGALTYACVNDNNTDVACPQYCADILATCTGTDNQYQDEATCERICAKMDHGEAGTATGDNIACRAIDVSSAKDEPDPNKKHQDCVSGGVATDCGNDPCTAFCKLDLALCPTTLSLYKDVNDCVTHCQGWRDNGFAGQLIPSTGNTLQCRTYHLELAQSGQVSDLNTHCPHTGDPSALCQDPDGGAGDASTDAPAE